MEETKKYTNIEEFIENYNNTSCVFRFIDVAKYLDSIGVNTNEDNMKSFYNIKDNSITIKDIEKYPELVLYTDQSKFVTSTAIKADKDAIYFISNPNVDILCTLLKEQGVLLKYYADFIERMDSKDRTRLYETAIDALPYAIFYVPERDLNINLLHRAIYNDGMIIKDINDKGSTILQGWLKKAMSRDLIIKGIRSNSKLLSYALDKLDFR